MPLQLLLPVLALLVYVIAVPSPPSTIRSDICPIKIDQDPPAAPAAPPTQRQATVLNDTTSPQLHRQSITPRIVNGDLISPNLLPYMVALFDSDDFFQCTGTLISSTWVITAAHCETLDSSSLAEIGVQRATTGGLSVTRAIKRFIPHPDYIDDSAEEYDFALVELDSPAPSSAKFMKVNIDGSLPKAGEFARTMGYGTTRFDTSSDGFCRQVDVPISERSVCEEVYPSTDSKFQHCAGYPKGGCDSCQGDSGGPMIQYINNEPILVGAVSSGKDCAAPAIPGVYVRTAPFKSFMDDQSAEYTTSGSAGLSAGAIAGILIVCLLLVIVVVVGAIFFIRKRGASDSVPTAPLASTQPPPGTAPGAPPTQLVYPATPPTQLMHAHPAMPPTQPGYPGVPTVPVPVYLGTPTQPLATPVSQPQYMPPTYPASTPAPIYSVAPQQMSSPPQAPASLQMPPAPQNTMVAPTPPPPNQ